MICIAVSDIEKSELWRSEICHSVDTGASCVPDSKCRSALFIKFSTSLPRNYII